MKRKKLWAGQEAHGFFSFRPRENAHGLFNDNLSKNNELDLRHGTGQIESGAFKYHMSNLNGFAVPAQGIKLFQDSL